jgi:hypothetical protein
MRHPDHLLSRARLGNVFWQKNIPTLSGDRTENRIPLFLKML